MLDGVRFEFQVSNGACSVDVSIAFAGLRMREGSSGQEAKRGRRGKQGVIAGKSGRHGTEVDMGNTPLLIFGMPADAVAAFFGSEWFQISMHMEHPNKERQDAVCSSGTLVKEQQRR